MSLDTATPPARPFTRTGVLELAKLAHLSGLAQLQGMMAGDFPAPPISEAMEFWMTEAEEGRVVFVGHPSPRFLNPIGTIHGGWTGTLMDSALACAVHATLAPGEAYTTLEFKVSCLRPILPNSGPMRCEGKVVHRGRRAATSEAWLTDAAGKLYAHGTETCMIFEAQKPKA
jgi:uncharacterized protein (TIGR00369 family)